MERKTEFKKENRPVIRKTDTSLNKLTKTALGAVVGLSVVGAAVNLLKK
jgi:hypothetical protein